MESQQNIELHLLFEGVTYSVQVNPEEEQRINADPDYAYALCLQLRTESEAAVQAEGPDKDKGTTEGTTTEIVEAEEMIWTDAAIYLLLEEYRKRKESFRNPKLKKRDLWIQIQKVFASHSYQKVTIDSLDKKFRNLKQTYSRIKESQNVKKKTGEASIRWKFYEIMQEIFHSDDSVSAPSPPIESTARKTCMTATPLLLPTEPFISPIPTPQMLSSCTVSSVRADLPTTSVHSVLPAELPQVSSGLTTRLLSASSSADKSPSVTNQSMSSTLKNKAKLKKQAARRNLNTYRSEVLQTEKDRVAAIKELKSSIVENTNVMKTIAHLQEERNQLLKQLIPK